METVVSDTIILAEQGSGPDGCRLPEAPSDTFILIKITVYKTFSGRSSPGSSYRPESQTILGDIHFWIDFPKIKKIPSSYRTYYTTRFVDFMVEMNVPEDEHDLAIDKLFNVLDEEAVSPELSICLDIFDMNYRVSEELNHVPATRESILGLERVRLQLHHWRAKRHKVDKTCDGLIVGEETTCSICLESYADEEQVVNRLPCGHYYHGDCIIQWLHISHLCPLCPLCRFAMPTPSTPCEEVNLSTRQHLESL